MLNNFEVGWLAMFELMASITPNRKLLYKQYYTICTFSFEIRISVHQIGVVPEMKTIKQYRINYINDQLEIKPPAITEQTPPQES